LRPEGRLIAGASRMYLKADRSGGVGDKPSRYEYTVGMNDSTTLLRDNLPSSSLHRARIDVICTDVLLSGVLPDSVRMPQSHVLRGTLPLGHGE
jgi:hypothetical protein